MNAALRLLLALTLLEATPVFAAKPPGQPSTPEPSVQLRRMIDTTLPKITDISKPKQKPIDRTALIEAQADFSAKAQTAPPTEQPMYKAALNVVANLVGAVDEHEKAVAAYAYSNNLHGKQDREDSKVSNWQRGWGSGKAAFADNAKQKMENADSRNALLDKEQFMNNGNASSWTQRVGQIHEIVEQSFTTELIAEKQLAMLTPATPPPVPVTKPAPKPMETSAAEQYSPVGTWKAEKGQSLVLNGDGTASRGPNTGTWKWIDQSKGTLTFTWTTGRTVRMNFSADGQKLTGNDPSIANLNFSRSQ